jgi:hypothetical protein
MEPLLPNEWELNIATARTGLRNKPGTKPQWSFTNKNGKLVWGNKRGGIDWWRYQNKVLKPKHIPFAQKYLKERPNTIV